MLYGQSILTEPGDFIHPCNADVPNSVYNLAVSGLEKEPIRSSLLILFFSSSWT